MRYPTVFAALAMVAGCIASPSRAAEPEDNTASVFATVGHSEWCPPGTVQLDLMTGRYTVTAPLTWRTCRRPPWARRTRTGVVPSLELIPLQVTYDMVTVEGLEHHQCRGRGRPEQIVVSNGRTPLMRLTDRGRTISAPNDRACWTGAASRLQCLLEAAFMPGDRRSGTWRLRPESGPNASPAAVRNCSRRWPLMDVPIRLGV
jgi:hypothetical protein